MDAWGSTQDTLGRIELAFADAPVPTAIFSIHGGLLHANAALRELLDGRWGPALWDAFGQQIRPRPRRVWEVEQRLEALGSALVVRLAFARSRHADGDQIVVQVIDVTAARTREEHLERLSEREPLTDLWNRRRFEQELALVTERCRRHDTVATLTVLDVDGLKQINDRHGHQCGDAAIVHVARSLARRMRASDALARIGGDEFAVLLNDTTADAAAEAVDALCAAVADLPVMLGREPVTLTISAGYVGIAADSVSAEALFAAADRALYRAKAAGRGCAVRAG